MWSCIQESKEILDICWIFGSLWSTKELRVAADASSYGLECVFSHALEDGKTTAKRKYSQIEREALAVIFAVSKLRMYLWGRNFQLMTDHQPLITLIGREKRIPEMASSRIQRWTLAFSA